MRRDARSAEQKSVIDTLSSDLRIVREKLDDNNVRVGLAQEVTLLREPDHRDAQGGDVPHDAAAPADPAAAAAAPPAAGLGHPPQRAYDAALSDYWGSDYELAVNGFKCT